MLGSDMKRDNTYMTEAQGAIEAMEINGMVIKDRYRLRPSRFAKETGPDTRY